MKAIKNLVYTTVLTAGLGLGTLFPNYATAQTTKDVGLSFYEHVDANQNGKVDDGETLKLARIVFEEGENIAIDSKFKSGTGNLYVVSEKGEIVKSIPQQYDTGVKTPRFLEGLPAGDYTTVFQKEGLEELNGSYLKVVPKGESVSQNVTRAENDKKGISLLEKKNYIVASDGWNDFNGDNAPQRWEVTNPRDARGTTFYAGQSATFLSKSGMVFNTFARLKKKRDKSFEKFEFKEKKTRKKTVTIKTPILTEGSYDLQIGQMGAIFKAVPRNQ